MSVENGSSKELKTVLKEFAQLLHVNSEASEKRHAKSDAKVDGLIDVLHEHTVALLESKKDREYDLETMRRLEKNQISQGEQIKVLSETLLILNERQSKDDGRWGKVFDTSHKIITAILLAGLGYLISSNASAVDLSTFEPVGDIQSVAGMNELSGGVWVDSLNGAAYVDNGSGRLEYPGSGASCYPGGDLEAVTNYQEGKLYTVNEAKNGVSVINTNGCIIERRFLTDIDDSGSDGIEGIAVYAGVVYLLEEVTGNIYWFIDTGGTARVTTTLLFTITNCVNAGDLTIDADGNFLIACEPPSSTVVQYDMSGNYLGFLNDQLITNPEVVYFDNLGNLWVGGEPSQLRQYSGNTIPRETESCAYSGSIDVYADNGAIVAPQSVSLICPTATASGTIQ